MEFAKASPIIPHFITLIYSISSRGTVFSMAMAWIWTVMVSVSVVFGILNGTIDAVGSAAMEGAGAAVQFILSIGGMICLWSGIMEIMNRSGLSEKLSGLLRPILARLFPASAKDPETMNALSANVSANLLGLGNAATPSGIRASELMQKRSGSRVACDDLCMLVVMNTASIQLIPATVAAVRASAGAAAPFDILPAVWITSAASVTVGVLVAKLLRRFWAGN